MSRRTAAGPPEKLSLKDPEAQALITVCAIVGVAVAVGIAMVATDPAIEAIGDLTEPHARAAATLTFALALTPLWLTASYVGYRSRRTSTGHNIPMIALIVASAELSLIFLGPKRSSGEDTYLRNVAEHGGSVAPAIAIAGDGAALIAVAVLPTLIVTALVCKRRNATMTDKRFGQIAVSVLVGLALIVLTLTLSGDLTSPLPVTPRR